MKLTGTSINRHDTVTIHFFSRELLKKLIFSQTEMEEINSV